LRRPGSTLDEMLTALEAERQQERQQRDQLWAVDLADLDQFRTPLIARYEVALATLRGPLRRAGGQRFIPSTVGGAKHVSWDTTPGRRHSRFEPTGVAGM
jgi:hypothetical protein